MAIAEIIIHSGSSFSLPPPEIGTMGVIGSSARSSGSHHPSSHFGDVTQWSVM